MRRSLGIPSSWRLMPVGFHAVVLMTLSLAAAAPCHGQWARLSQRDLRGFTEKALAERLVTVRPPVISRVSDSRWSRVLVIDFGDYLPTEFADDPIIAAALDDQFRVTIIRTYRNKPAWRKYWAPTLAAVEQKIQDMLTVLAAPWTIEQKDFAINQLEDEIDLIYRQHFERWASDEGLGGWRVKPRPAESLLYDIRLEAVPAGTVSYMPAGPWELYQYLTNTKKVRDVPYPKWETPQTRDAVLGGKYWFKASFESMRKQPVFGPIMITRDGTLIITPTRIHQQ